jgi:hypothetical protein
LELFDAGFVLFQAIGQAWGNPFFVGIHVVACEKSNFGGISSPVCALAGRSTFSGLQKIYSWGYFCILLNSSGLEYV